MLVINDYQSHRIHGTGIFAYIYHKNGTGIFTYIYHKNQPNVGKYTSPMDPMGMICSALSGQSATIEPPITWNS